MKLGIACAVLGFNFLGDALRHRLNPHTRVWIWDFR